jgi:ppGpp synthetase/RelA/SpoT-type nucleotidyltranferase
MSLVNTNYYQTKKMKNNESLEERLKRFKSLSSKERKKERKKDIN